MTPANPLRIAILHPELGLGGAERFILDAAQALIDRGHRVKLFAARRDESRAFAAALGGALDVGIVAPRLPVRVLGRLQAPLTILALGLCAVRARREMPDADAVLIDVASAAVPLVRGLGFRRVVFYGHYPDLLQSDHSGLRAWYRRPLDAWELRGLRAADRVLVNSEFTREAFQRVFPSLTPGACQVLYPAIRADELTDIPPLPAEPADPFEVLCLSRFTPEKGHALALEAFQELLRSDLTNASRFFLTLAGGYDERFPEQQELVATLRQRANDASLAGRVRIETSVSDAQKRQLLERATVLAYPPVDEHFGLVPLEAMAAARPVVASNSGGPRETVQHGRTGLLVEPTANAFRDAFASLVADRVRTRDLGLAGRELVQTRFSFAQFAEQLERGVSPRP